MVASIAASKDRELAFAVLLAAPAIKGEQILLDQTQTFARAAGENEETIARKLKESKEIFDTIVAEPDQHVLRGKLYQLLARYDYDSEENNSRETKAHSMSTPWFRCFLGLVISDFISKITCPILAMNGTQDTQVLADPNIAAIEAAIAGMPNSTAVKLPGLNHMFQQCNTGMPWEYHEIHEAISPFVIDLIADWIWSLLAQKANAQSKSNPPSEQEEAPKPDPPHEG
jgi:pimeloyl-ACP methyl ester carboxylesterase